MKKCLLDSKSGCLISLHPNKTMFFFFFLGGGGEGGAGTRLSVWSFYQSDAFIVLTLYHTIPTFNDPKKKGLENTGSNQHFLLFPQCFLPYLEGKSTFKQHLLCCLQMLSIWTRLKFCSLVKS